mmetsp:Transcript_9993/g.24905  ORF Transcript_9993/g.24905 Transcript_9993/m.24905 type:complete len:202 (+) Transcript_9993:1227-1832(+)
MCSKNVTTSSILCWLCGVGMNAFVKSMSAKRGPKRPPSKQYAKYRATRACQELNVGSSSPRPCDSLLGRWSLTMLWATTIGSFSVGTSSPISCINVGETKAFSSCKTFKIDRTKDFPSIKSLPSGWSPIECFNQVMESSLKSRASSFAWIMSRYIVCGTVQRCTTGQSESAAKRASVSRCASVTVPLSSTRLGHLSVRKMS